MAVARGGHRRDGRSWRDCGAGGHDARHFSFAYDQPHSTGYGIAADLFNNKLMEIPSWSMAIDQFPGAQLGHESVRNAR